MFVLKTISVWISTKGRSVDFYFKETINEHDLIKNALNYKLLLSTFFSSKFWENVLKIIHATKFIDIISILFCTNSC